MRKPETVGQPSPAIERAGYREPAWCAEAGIGRTTLWKEIKLGRVRVKKCGRATIIVTSPRQWLESLPAA